MKKEILIKILQLDSLVNILSWYERVCIHQNVLESSSLIKINELYEWILKENWESPETKYGQDRILYFYDVDSDTWMQENYYLKLFIEYEPWIKQLKNKYRI